MSDIHLEDGFFGSSVRSFANKRFVGWANLSLRRRPLYADAVSRLEALRTFAEELEVDAILCTGDLTALGTPREHAFARKHLRPFERWPLVIVPGNHDVYLEDALRSFAETFGELLTSDVDDVATDGVYPLVRFLSDDVAAICVNSARPNPSIRVSSGRIPEAQLEGLKRIIAMPELQKRFVFVMTHYAPRLKSGEPDHPHHGLENAEDFLAACAGIQRGAILHGHVHHNYRVDGFGSPLPLFCAGSTTMKRREGLWVFDVDGRSASAAPGHFADGRYFLREQERAPVHSTGSPPPG